MTKKPFPPWLIAALLVLGTVAIYWPATQGDFINFDDPDYVSANVHVQSGLTWSSIKWACASPVVGNWHPITMLSHTLVCQFFGSNPWGHHLTNMLLHALNVALVFALLQQMTGARWRSLVVAALFAVHPLSVEDVAWVSERKDVLSAFFFMLTLWTYVRFTEVQRPKSKGQSLKSEGGSHLLQTTDHGPRTTDHRSLITDHRSLFFLLSLFFFALGLMSKPMLVTLPFVLLLLDYWPLRRLARAFHAQVAADVSRRHLAGEKNAPTDVGGYTLPMNRAGNATSGLALSTKPLPSTLNSQLSTILPLLLEKLPFLVLSALGCVMTFAVQQRAGAMTGSERLALDARVGNALISYCRYLGKLFWPTNLAVFYPHPEHWPLGKVLLAGGVLVGLSVLVWTHRRRHPCLLMGWLWFAGMLVPVIGLVQVGNQAMADRYAYLPSLGITILCVWGVCEMTRGWRYQVPALSAAVGTAVVLCLALTREQVSYWKDSETLFRHALAVTKDNWLAYNNLGGALEEKGQLDEAIRLYRESIRLDPISPDGHNNLGIALGKQGQIDEAIRQFQEALRLQPDHAQAHNNLGNALLGKGQLDEAIIQFHEAIRLQPENTDAHFNLGVALGGKGQADEAIRQYQETLRLDPGYAQAYNNLGIAFAGKGQIDQAISQFQQALSLRPDYADARRNLDIALAAKARSSQPPAASTKQ